MSLLLGFDVGSSSVKATLLDAQTGEVLASAGSPDKELEIIAPQSGWAEQHPDIWWENIVAATAKVKAKHNFAPADVKAIGISYQMHGLVTIDKNNEILRPSIIWCDSRAVSIGEQAAKDIGQKKCLKNLLNLPGNFTASKLKWVKDNEPDIYKRIHKIMLPGDYIAMKLTGSIATTESGLSEGIMWNFKKNCLADFVLDNYGISEDLIADTVGTFSVQGELTRGAADELGLAVGTKVSYRAGDQPNNALSLNVLNPGEIAATAGTSGVVYAVTDKVNYDEKSRVNVFVHVNHSSDAHRYGVLLCVNGTGILNSWLKHNFSDSGALDYPQMDKMTMEVPAGSQGLMIFPYGNGAERTLENRDIGASVRGWNFNVHDKTHFFRAAQEGIVFGLNYGLEIIRDIGIELKTVRAGHANMFLSPLFADMFAALTDATVQLYDTDGSQGAARGAGFGVGIYKTLDEAFVGLKPLKTIEPDKKLRSVYNEIYGNWVSVLNSMLT